jgi:hypothetical protein
LLQRRNRYLLTVTVTRGDDGCGATSGENDDACERDDQHATSSTRDRTSELAGVVVGDVSDGAGEEVA